MKKHTLLVFSAFATLLVVATIIGCTGTGGILFPGGGGLPLFPPRFLVVFNESPTPETVSVFKVDATTGGLTAAGTPVNTMVDCCAEHLDIEPTSKFVFVPGAESGTNGVQVFGIDQTTGALTEATGAGSPFAAGNYVFSVKVHPSSKFVYAASFNDGTVTAFTLDLGTGKLTPIGSAVQATPNPINMTMDPLGRFLYVSDCGSECSNPDVVAGFKIDQTTGALTSIGATVATGLYPRTGVIDPSGKFFYVVDMNRNSAAGEDKISGFSIDSTTGALTPIPGMPLTSPMARPYGIAIPPSGGFLYFGAKDDTKIAAYKIDPSTGALTAVTGSPFDFSISFCHGLAADTSGKFLYVNDANDDTVLVLKIASDGTLTQLSPGSPVPVGNPGGFPTSLAVGH